MVGFPTKGVAVKRREFITFIGSLTACATLQPRLARPQPVRAKPRIGMLWHAGSAEEEFVYLAAFRQGLADVGYVEGQNITVEHRFPAEKPELFQSMAKELVELNLDVLVAAGQPPALALQHATTSIPIVFVAAYDPIGVGLVTSLARPSGNITGFSLPDLIEKRLELFQQALPHLSRVTVLINATNQSYAQRYAEYVREDGDKLKLVIQLVDVDGASDLERAFSVIASDAAGGIAAAADVMFYNERKKIIASAMARRLPSIFHNEEFVKDGGLLSYGANVPAIFRRSATYVEKIVKGAKPSDLPVEQPNLYRTFANLQTARALGLTLPPTLLAMADEVIE
jgi:putative tryptophan/tyrosine transport system substrate-binding protein